MEYYDKSDIGRLRKINQDVTKIAMNQQQQLLAVVCDGMGGHSAGDLAAKMAVEKVIEEFEKIESFSTKKEAKHWMEETIAKANQSIYQFSFEKEEYQGMGTTIVLCIVMDSLCLISHVGDSRAYYIQQDTMEQITKDHTYVNLLIDTGTITQEQAIDHPKRNVLMKAVGVFLELKVDVIIKKINQGSLLLCTDGLYNGLQQADISNIVNKKELSVKEKVNQLITLANQHGGYDNVGIALIEFNQEDNKNGN